MTNRTIAELLHVPATHHDLDWLRDSLGAAIKLEFATIPPYLFARWSIKNGAEPAAQFIRVIFREEMLHMGLMCNMLNAIGGAPSLNSASDVPTYPGPLPGGVNPSLIVPLAGLSPQQLDVFLDIELPEHGPVAIAAGEAFPTIGAFYSAIQGAFESLQPAFKPDKQLEGPLGLFKVLNLPDVRSAITLIRRQGEGSQTSPEDMGPGDLAHYYRFKELREGRRLQKHADTGKWEFTGDPIPFPEVWPVVPVPKQGYQHDDVTDPTVWALIAQFDRAFSTMLDQLQTAWANGNDGALDDAIGTMSSLRSPAVQLMQTPLPGGLGNYGPCFRLVGGPRD